MSVSGYDVWNGMFGCRPSPVHFKWYVIISPHIGRCIWQAGREPVFLCAGERAGLAAVALYFYLPPVMHILEGVGIFF